VGRQSALHKENSGFAAPTPGRHISTFRGYRILFSKPIEMLGLDNMQNKKRTHISYK
jgi:hypothetical protein